MAAEQIKYPMIYETNVEGHDKIKDSEILNFLEPNDKLVSVPAETHVLKSEEKENKPASFTEKLYPSKHNSSSINEEGGVGKNNSEGLKDKIKEIGGEKEQGKNAEHDQIIGKGVTCPEETEDKKGGYGEKIKEKLPGTQKTDEHEQQVSAGKASSEETENNKGLMGKIKEKLPGGTNKSNEVAPEYDSTEAKKHKEELEEKKGLRENIKEKLPGKKPVEREDGTYY